MKIINHLRCKINSKGKLITKKKGKEKRNNLNTMRKLAHSDMEIF